MSADIQGSHGRDGSDGGTGWRRFRAVLGAHGGNAARLVVTLVGWLVIVFLALAALARGARLSDDSSRLFALETMTVWLYLPAYVVLVVAAFSRRRLLAAVAALLVVAHLAWVVPDLRWWTIDQPTASGDPITLVAANVRADNDRPREAAAVLGRLEADVLVVVELTPGIRASLDTAGVLGRFPFRIEDPRPGRFGSAIYSRFPLASAQTFELRGSPSVRAQIALPGTTATVVAVHTQQPLSGLSVLRRQLGDLRRMAEAIDGPVIFAGDFNATRQHRAFRSLVAGRLRDVHIEAGRGFARTWPVGRSLPPFALLDHVLVSERFVVDSVGEATLPGSDHRAVKVGLAWGRRTLLDS